MPEATQSAIYRSGSVMQPVNAKPNSSRTPSFLRCPVCRSSPLFADGEDGLACPNGHRFPLRAGITMFAQDNAFDSHWDEFGDAHLPSTKLRAALRFMQPLLDGIPTENRFRLLDAGCGNGVHAAALCADFCGEDRQYVGIDLSVSALVATQRVAPPGSLFFQGDIAKLPFEDGTFDAVLSYGVIAYTPDPQAVLREFTRILRPGGVLAVWVYPRREGIGSALFDVIRLLARLGGQRGAALLANSIVPFLGLLPTESGLNLCNASWKQCREIVMVNIAPTTLHVPTATQLCGWLEAAGLMVEVEDHEHPLTLYASRSFQKG